MPNVSAGLGVPGGLRAVGVVAAAACDGRGPATEKYYKQRYDLFSLFDLGVVLDREMWFSVTPEAIARQVANRLACHTIVDACCGAGGNAIQFAFTCRRVIAIDIDPVRIQIARHNAAVYGVDHLIEFIQGDAIELLPRIRAHSVDTVFLSPPWGGPDYKKVGAYDVTLFARFFRAARQLTPNVALMIPKTCSEEDIVQIFGDCQLEYSQIRQRTKAIMAYFGDLNEDADSSETESPPRKRRRCK